ncbi:MAG: hypothetical protein ACHQPI_04470 [Thermoanaerobaculia bacterium]
MKNLVYALHLVPRSDGSVFLLLDEDTNLAALGQELSLKGVPVRQVDPRDLLRELLHAHPSVVAGTQTVLRQMRLSLPSILSPVALWLSLRFQIPGAPPDESGWALLGENDERVSLAALRTLQRLPFLEIPRVQPEHITTLATVLARIVAEIPKTAASGRDSSRKPLPPAPTPPTPFEIRPEPPYAFDLAIDSSPAAPSLRPITGEDMRFPGKAEVRVPPLPKEETPMKPSWRPTFSSYTYEEVNCVTFASDSDLERAVMLFWDKSSPLFRVPRELVDARRVLIPSEAVRFLRRAKISFQVHKVVSAGTLSPQERARSKKA